MPPVPKKTPLASALQGVRTPKSRATPLWAGPEDSGPQGGVTQSLLSTWLTCRERARLKFIEGLRPADAFNHFIFFGNAWHAMEEAFAKGRGGPLVIPNDSSPTWETALRLETQKEQRKYKTASNAIDKWYNVLRVTFPEYASYWAKHKDVTERTPIEQEQVFHVAYKLPSGRTVYLRGKRDAVDLCGAGKDAGIWLFETKTKSEIDEVKLRRQLLFDLQTGLYLVSLYEDQKRSGQYRLGGQGIPRSAPIKGVRYNVVRRPLSGGKGSIVQSKGTKGTKCGKCKGERTIMMDGVGGIGANVYKAQCPKCKGIGRIGGEPPETAAEYYERVRSYIVAEPHTYFARFNVTVTPAEVERFRRCCLDPMLEQLCDWYDTVAFAKTNGLDPFASGTGRNWIHPFGVRNVLDEGGATDLDECILTGSRVGLVEATTLFGELA